MSRRTVFQLVMTGLVASVITSPAVAQYSPGSLGQSFYEIPKLPEEAPMPREKPDSIIKIENLNVPLAQCENPFEWFGRVGPCGPHLVKEHNLEKPKPFPPPPLCAFDYHLNPNSRLPGQQVRYPHPLVKITCIHGMKRKAAGGWRRSGYLNRESLGFPLIQLHPSD